MSKTTYLILALLILFAPAFCTGGCSLDLGRELPSEPPDAAQNNASAESWTRLRPIYWTADDGSRFLAQWHFWANPATLGLPDYAAAIYKPLRDAESATPYAWRPFYDSQLRSPCLFYQTEDGEVRCLPGWVQMEPDDPRDGFYSEPTCSDIKHWVYALPASEAHGTMAQRYLVTATPMPHVMPRVYEQKPFLGQVWWKFLAADGKRYCEEVSGDRFRFYERGDIRLLTEFVKLGKPEIDAGPSPG